MFALGAGAIHAATIRYESTVSALFGAAFVAMAVGQIGWFVLVTTFPRKWIALAGILGNAAVIGIWALTRTVGAPVGPYASTPLPVGFPDAVATTLEGLAVVAGTGALALSRRARTVSAPVRSGIVVAAYVITVPLATLAVLAQTGVLASLPAST